MSVYLRGLRDDPVAGISHETVLQGYVGYEEQLTAAAKAWPRHLPLAPVVPQTRPWFLLRNLIDATVSCWWPAELALYETEFKLQR